MIWEEHSEVSDDLELWQVKYVGGEYQSLDNQDTHTAYVIAKDILHAMQAVKEFHDGTAVIKSVVRKSVLRNLEAPK